MTHATVLGYLLAAAYVGACVLLAPVGVARWAAGQVRL